MKQFAPIVAFALALSMTCAFACTSWLSPKVIKTALDVTQIACIIAHDWTDDESWIARQCNIVDDVLPEVRKLIAARKQAAAMKAKMQSNGTYGATPGDAGHD